jgi:transposase-like protein
MLRHFNTLIELCDAFPHEQACIDHLTAIRWRAGKFCPLCGNAEEARIGTLTGTNTHKCYVCRQRFSIRVGTIFQDTKLPLRKWFIAIWMVTSHTKGIASTVLAKDLGVTQKTAWFVLHRLRHAARTPSFQAPLQGVVEIDETFIGGREENKHADKRMHQKGGTGGKTVVMGILERDGDLRAGVVDNTRKDTLEPIIEHHVAAGAIVYTDEHLAYRALDQRFDHSTVRHSRREYVRGPVHTNGIESVWALLKRQIIGIHHWVSPKHLDQYVAEMTFRFNTREMKSGERCDALLGQIEGPLPYKVLTA